jgi:hypothetical protein
MKKKRLQLRGLFTEYCDTYKFKCQSELTYIGYETPEHGTHIIAESGTGTGDFAIAVVDDKIPHVLYGFKPIDFMIGYLQGKIDAHKELVK